MALGLAVDFGLSSGGCARMGERNIPAPASALHLRMAPPISSAIQGDPLDDDDSPAALRSWRRLDSPHFALKTDRPDAEARRILFSLEEYFAALTSVFFPAASLPSERMPVIAVGSETETRRYLPVRISGVFVEPVHYQPLIVLGQNQYGFDDSTVRHELVHYAMRLSLKRFLPLWYAEGMASYFETLAYDRAGSKLLVGRASIFRVSVLRDAGLLLPVESLVGGGLDGMIESEPDQFYATSWLLIHSLIHEAPDVFAAYEHSLLAGESSSDAWRAAAPAAVRGTIDQQLTRYLRESLYERGRRLSWSAPAFEISTQPLGVGDALAVRALLNLVGARLQSSRAGYHDERAVAHAEAALAQDPTNLVAVQVKLTEHRPVAVSDLRTAVHHNEARWTAWLTLYDALDNDNSARDERTQALARAASLAPDDPEILIRLAYQAFNLRRWQDAIGLFSRARVVSPDHLRFAHVYLTALSHHERCGAMVPASAVRMGRVALSPGEQEGLIRSVELCLSASDGFLGQSAKSTGQSRSPGSR